MANLKIRQIKTKKHCCCCIPVIQLVKTLIDRNLLEAFSNFDQVECKIIDVTHRQYSFSSMHFEVVVHASKNHAIHLIAKLSKNCDYLSFNEHEKEKLFYKVLAYYINPSYAVTCYTYKDYEELSTQPILLMDNLTTLNYKQPRDKLNQSHLKVCIKGLAQFHADTYNLQKNNRKLYQYIHQRLLEMDNARTNEEIIGLFTNATSDWNEMDHVMREKIKAKLYELQYSRSNAFLTIIHGRFVRTKVMFRYNYFNRPCQVKIIGWESMRFASPGIDFGRILLTNLPNETDVSKLVAFCREMLTVYMKIMKREYPQVHCKDLERNIIDDLMLTYINHFRMIENYLTILHVLRKLGSFDPMQFPSSLPLTRAPRQLYSLYA